MADEIMTELWRAKDEIARRYNYDLDALAAHLRDMSHRSGRAVVDLSVSREEPRQDMPGDSTGTTRGPASQRTTLR